MSNHIVIFSPDGRVAEAATGENLLEIARRLAIPLDSACGGQGTCGKCKVQVTLGRVDTAGPADHGDLQVPQASLLREEEAARGYVLACQSTVVGDLVVEVPPESQRGEIRILLGEEAAVAPGARTPLTEKIALSLRPPQLDDSRADADRLALALAAEGFSPVTFDLPALRALPATARASSWHLSARVADLGDAFQVIGVESAEEPSGNYGLAIDVGTTTVVVQLVDLATGGLVGTRAALNDEILAGDDVISRMVWAEERPDGLVQLQKAVVGTINRLIGGLREEHGIAREEISCVSCAGNTVMTQFLLAVDPGPLRREPYVPATREFPILRAADIGLDVHPRGPVHCQPSVSSYVGGDITAGVLATGLDAATELTMLLDMGTNGELVIGRREWMVCCSCSAGPAFEGSGIHHGMYAAPGALERVTYDPKTDRVGYRTVGDAKPRGICGSGLVDALATLLRAGVIDRAGRIDLGWSSPRVRVSGEDEPEFVLVWGEEIGREQDITLTESDIRNLIRSKAAVYAGAALLLRQVGLSPEQLARVLVAGAFGNYLDVKSAVTIGLLPDLPLDRIRFAGNTSVIGARLSLLSRAAREQATELAARITNFELSAENAFMDEYVAGLFLPHTDLRRFPTVARVLEVRAP